MLPLPHTPSRIKTDLRALGVKTDQTVMLHASVKAVGPVMGGPNTLLQALFDVLGSKGTLMMYAGWQDIPDFVGELPDDAQAAYIAAYPPFDPATSRSVRENSILAEFLRTWPGSQRSGNPEASIVANGARADWLTRDHPLNYGYGAGSPLAKLVEIGGSVLMLGAPLDTITLLHHAEYTARLRHKQITRYLCPFLEDGKTTWIQIEDFATGDPHDAYTFEGIALAYLNEGNGRTGCVGDADCYLFEAADLHRFAVDWLEARFS